MTNLLVLVLPDDLNRKVQQARTSCDRHGVNFDQALVQLVGHFAEVFPQELEHLPGPVKRLLW